jgi:hypothetical protein
MTGAARHTYYPLLCNNAFQIFDRSFAFCGYQQPAFNLTNHPNFSLPANNEQAGNFGQITQTTPEIQLALRLQFERTRNWLMSRFAPRCRRAVLLNPH